MDVWDCAVCTVCLQEMSAANVSTAMYKKCIRRDWCCTRKEIDQHEAYLSDGSEQSASSHKETIIRSKQQRFWNIISSDALVHVFSPSSFLISTFLSNNYFDGKLVSSCKICPNISATTEQRTATEHWTYFNLTYNLMSIFTSLILDNCMSVCIYKDT